MYLRTTISPHPPPPLNLLPLSSFASRTSLPLRRRAAVQVRCSISQVHSYGTVDYERREPLKWSSLYRRIATAVDDGDVEAIHVAAVLEQWEKEERRINKWVASRVVKELRKFRRYHLALQVYDWMTAQGDRFSFMSSDMAIKLDLIAKVLGVERAEEHFSNLPDTFKDKRTYGALLNAYSQAKMKEKTEATLEIMRSRGYAIDALPFNVTMTLYMNVGEHEKVTMIINEMKEKNVPFDVFSYNIWITNCAAMGDTDEMERVVERMNLDSSINANWTTYTTLTTMYIKMGNYEKAHVCLKEAEIRMTGRDRTPYNYILGLYSSIGRKEDVYRIWRLYKSSFTGGILNLGYQSMLSSLVKLGDAEGAETIYDEWVSTTLHYDPKICNILLGFYAKEGLVDKANSVLDRFLDKGAKPRPSTWAILAEGYIKDKQIGKALSCLKEAASCRGARTWRPYTTNIESLLALCKEHNDTTSVSMLKDVLRSMDCLELEEYKSLFSTWDEALSEKR